MLIFNIIKSIFQAPKIYQCNYCSKDVVYTKLTQAKHASSLFDNQAMKEHHFCNIHCLKHFLAEYRIFHNISTNIKTYLIKNDCGTTLFEAILSIDDNHIIFEVTQQSSILTKLTKTLCFVNYQVQSHDCVEIKYDGGLQVFIKGNHPDNKNKTFYRFSPNDIEGTFNEINKLLIKFVDKINTEMDLNNEKQN